MRWFIVVALLLAVSCNSKSKSAPETNGAATGASPGKAAMSKFTLTEAGDDTNKVTVEFAVPATWQTDSSMPVSWKMDGARMLSLVTVSTGGRDTATRVGKAIKMQWSDLTGATRNDYPDGRVWISKADAMNVNARMFVPYAGGVVMGVSVLSDASKIAGVKAAFETLKIAQ